ncbi:CDGSH iron-sulfur domain-containing protein [Streptomyces sp. NPDC007818]|uniref:CDGSH iron-sulfur domain-containing protein n=1 Tax=Streptomyces sp. NPDC007818 TaxID=3364780 RepID=UPI003693A042
MEPVPEQPTAPAVPAPADRPPAAPGAVAPAPAAGPGACTPAAAPAVRAPATDPAVRALAADPAVRDPAVRVTPLAEGPLLIEGPVEVVMADGTVRRSERPVVALCRCRRSLRDPFCDTSHRRRARPRRSDPEPPD